MHFNFMRTRGHWLLCRTECKRDTEFISKICTFRTVSLACVDQERTELTARIVSYGYSFIAISLTFSAQRMFRLWLSEWRYLSSNRRSFGRPLYLQIWLLGNKVHRFFVTFIHETNHSLKTLMNATSLLARTEQLAQMRLVSITI